jgi:hypothetical protein
MAKKSREEIDHYVLDQFEQEKHLNIGHERTKNLGHDWRESEIEKNPAGRVVDYESGPAARVIDEPRSVGVYGRFKNPQSGISSEQNLNKWGDYARSNSYHRGPGPGQEPPAPEPRRSVPSEARNKDSDGHLAPLPTPSMSNWATYTAGGDSGEGRLQKIGKR